MTAVPVAMTDVRELVDGALRAAVGRLDPRTYRVAAYHLGWTDKEGRPRTAPAGKALRPALALLSARAAVAPQESALPAAVAVELTHAFSLLHDDIMDGDTTRRHRPAAWTVFGANPTILAGDALQTLALDVLAAGGHPAAQDGVRMLSAAVLDLINGQVADLDFETRDDVGLAECVRMAELKTGALLGCACALGALFGGAPDKAEPLRRLGLAFGTAFQHVDDLLGIWGSPETTGKSIHSDLRSRKKSLPVVAALTSDTSAGRELAGLYFRERELSDVELARAAELVEAAGGREWSRRQADDLMERAMGELRDADLVRRPAEELGALARFATRRDH